MGYFTQAEIKAIETALIGVSKVGINIESYGDADKQRKAFFDKAKLWRVIERIIAALYISRLSEGKMLLHNVNGDNFRVIKIKEDLKGNQWITIDGKQINLNNAEE